MNKTLFIGGVLLALSLALFGFFSLTSKKNIIAVPPSSSIPPVSPAPLPDSPLPPPVVQHPPLPFGEVTLKLNQLAEFQGISIRPISITEDSRCPEGAQCIWAGRVRVQVEIRGEMGASTSTLTLGEQFSIGGNVVTLLRVSPNKSTKVTIPNPDYRFVFAVNPKGEKPPVSQGKCYVGGCSSQLCSDQPDVVSTCEYTESYACYKTATCERQQSGECGWTETTELSACLASSSPAR